jgi:transposase InsO family protein
VHVQVGDVRLFFDVEGAKLIPEGSAMREKAVLPSMGSVGDCFDNAVIESFWSRMQVELLDASVGRHESSLPMPSSSTSRSSTTANGGTPRPVCSARSSSRLAINQHRQRESKNPAPQNPGHP